MAVASKKADRVRRAERATWSAFRELTRIEKRLHDLESQQALVAIRARQSLDTLDADGVTLCVNAYATDACHALHRAGLADLALEQEES